MMEIDISQMCYKLVVDCVDARLARGNGVSQAQGAAHLEIKTRFRAAGRPVVTHSFK